MTNVDDNSPQLLAEDTVSANRTSAVVAVLAAVALLGNCLLSSPHRFSEAHFADRSLLKSVVGVLGLNAAFPTWRGVEIRNLVFYFAAAALALVAGLKLLIAAPRPRMSDDDLWDIRRRALRPNFWWALLLLVSAISSTFSHAPHELMGQTIIRALHMAWWLPLAALLTPQHARRLMTALLVILALTATLSFWYHVERGAPGQRLGYPFGNELFLAACLLPGVFLSLSLLPAGIRAAAWRRPLILVGLLIAGGVIVLVLRLTQSRSAMVGIIAGGFVIACLSSPRRIRPVVFVVAFFLAVGGASYFQSFRPHSIRARLDHEWPYAIVMFLQKMVVGHGDGAYSLLAGRIGREDQLGDPSVMSFDNHAIVHAHNEFLETLADLGIAGCIALVGAIVVTLVHAVRFVSSKEKTGDPGRWRVIGLAAALVAVLVDQCFEPAFRIPGLAPILLVCWALLWAMVRRSARPVEVRSDQERVSLSTVRAAGALVCAAALGLSYWGVRDWQGVRARYDAEVAMRDGRLEDAVERSDFAAQHTLAPFRRMVARTIAIQARILAFEAAVKSKDRPPNDAEMALGSDALARISQIERAAPRFPGVSQLQVTTCGAFVIACGRRNDPESARYFEQSLVAALERWRADEPFQSAPVVGLWQMRTDASVTHRLYWLRCLMRGGETDAAFRSLFASLVQHPDFARALDDLLNIAVDDKARAPEEWKDPLSPETLRIRALYATVQGRHREAAQFARSAADLYGRAGARLFAGHIAALHEAVSYEFAESPVAGCDQFLEHLAEAWAVEAGPTDPDTPLLGPIGWTRLGVLLAAGREQEAERQAAALEPGGPIEIAKAAALARIAAVVADDARFAKEAESWAKRACDLAPRFSGPVGLCIKFALRRGDDAAALTAATRLIELSDNGQSGPADEFLDNLQRQYPASGIWARLGRTLEEEGDGMGSSGEPDGSALGD